MPAHFWNAVKGVIDEADILLEVIDARHIDQTRNIEIEEKVRGAGKVLIYVFNKCDLADIDSLEHQKRHFNPCVFVSSKEYHGIKMLTEKIIIEGKRMGLKKPRVGVLGYPNMGKSSLINALNGKGSARASSESGFTRGKQYINARNFTLIDTPGVIPYGEKDDVKKAITGMETKLKDPETNVLRIMERYPGKIEKQYGAEFEEDDVEAGLESIAVKLNLLLKGKKPDTKRAAQQILRDLRDGKTSV